VNAAPFSFFNAVSSVPPVVVLGISPGAASEDSYKDTERNIRDSGEFVVNLVDEALAERMNICAVDFPAGTGELNAAELTPLPRSASARRGSHNRRSASNAAASPACRWGPLDARDRQGHPYPHPR
jgi:flavin reductase (DIM6/NTAB) family NADH-FMN oxidoreductase RutF